MCANTYIGHFSYYEAKMKISGWGNYPVVDTKAQYVHDISAAQTLVGTSFNGIAHAMGRSYGDSALASQVINPLRLDHILNFDPIAGVIDCECGVSLADIVETIVPHGWFLPVTPGTKFVSIGGAIASDVHGKNHHNTGSFSQFVESLDILCADGSVQICNRETNAELFRACCGGMGLTGIILRAKLKLIPIESAYIDQTVHIAENLQEILALFEQYRDATYSVAWVDCLAGGKNLGRSVLFIGEHNKDHGFNASSKLTGAVPLTAPSVLLNKATVSLFNNLYFTNAKKRSSRKTVTLETFFYPLDNILHWNRLYGKNGFLQYQFVIPKQTGASGLHEILSAIAESGKGSFLSVLKLLGGQNENYLSFPMEGYTLALDFKMQPGLTQFLTRLDDMVMAHGGRIYLAKDARLSATVFRATYPRWEQFAYVRAMQQAETKFNSLQSLRLKL
jgi:FAD/FMN-containing dehydrogenase